MVFLGSREPILLISWGFPNLVMFVRMFFIKTLPEKFRQSSIALSYNI